MRGNRVLIGDNLLGESEFYVTAVDRATFEVGNRCGAREVGFVSPDTAAGELGARVNAPSCRLLRYGTRKVSAFRPDNLHAGTPARIVLGR